MLWLYLTSPAWALRPVLFAPPLFGSQLHVTANNANVSWYCTKTFDDKLVWLSEYMLVPPIMNCMGEYLTSEWDDAANRPHNLTGTGVFSPDFGGDTSLRWVDEGILGLHFIPDLVNVLDEFSNHGYEIKKTMFGCPYDWRHGPLYIEDFYDRFRALIENAYESNGQQRVALFGYSEGAMVTHYFLTKLVSQEWKDKYIDRAVFTAPSFGGTLYSVKVAWDHWADKLPEIFRTEAIERFITSIPTMGAHMPNHHLIKDTPIVIGPNGEKFYAKDVQQFLYDHEKVTGSARNMVEAGREVYTSEIPHPGVDVYMIYNSGLDTGVSMDFRNGYDKPYVELKAPGDDTIVADVVRDIAQRWADQGKSPIILHDFNKTGDDWSHRYMVTAPEYTDMIYRVMTSDEWKVPGLHRVTGTDLRDWEKIKRA